MTTLSETFSQDYCLLAPGPVNLHPEVQKILSLPMIHHRTPEFDKILSKVLIGLRQAFSTTNQVYIHTGTGTGGMESLLVNTLSPGDEVLAIDSGKFGERWAEMATRYQMKVHILKIPWGKAVKPAQVEEFLTLNPQTKAVLCQACETSTATTHPLEKLGQVISKFPETLFLVDGITAVGAFPVPMDAWKIDGLVAGSQKAFMLPAGMSFVSFSPKAWLQIPKSKTIKYYFDIAQEKKANDKGETLFSSPVPLVRALEWVLKDIEGKTYSKHFSEINRRANLTREFVKLSGLSLYSEAPSDSVTAILLPSAIDGQALRQKLEDQFNITIMGGQDQAKGKIIRIGHMGYILDSNMLRLFEALLKSLASMGQTDITPEKTQAILSQLKKWQQDNP